MDQSAIFGPFFAMLGLSFVVWTYMYVRRIHFLQANAIEPDSLTGPQKLAELSPGYGTERPAVGVFRTKSNQTLRVGSHLLVMTQRSVSRSSRSKGEESQ